MHTRPTQDTDYPVLALLHNATQEPHFHTTAARMRRADERADPSTPPRVVLEHSGAVVGFATVWLPAFDPGRAWLGLHLHPDHLGVEVAQRLLAPLLASLPADISHLWTSVRADYRSAHPELAALGFHEVHRTFGGGFYLDDWSHDTHALEQRLAGMSVSFEPAQPWKDDPRLEALYASLVADQITAPPTITPANHTLYDPDQLWACAFVALHSGEPIGLAVPEQAGLGAWNAVLGVHADWRRRGIGTVLQARVCAALREQHIHFLNTAGVASDAAYLGVLCRLGSNIEPDWIAWGRNR